MTVNGIQDPVTNAEDYSHTHTQHFVGEPVMEFLNNLWGLGTEKEWGCRTGPPGYTAWRNWSLGIDSWAP
jgi:hypothetical protein